MTTDEMEWFHWLILIVPCLMLVFAGVWFAWLGRKPIFPKGRTVTERRGGYVVHFIDQTGLEKLNVATFAQNCSIAVWATGKVARRMEMDSDKVKEVVVLLKDPYAYDRAQPIPSAAYLTSTGASVGAGLPMAVIKGTEDYIAGVRRRGEPVIHEMVHLILGEVSIEGVDRDHHGVAWAANDSNGLQAQARTLYQSVT